MIIVTDTHIGKAAESRAAFFQMLAAIEKTGHDLVFLGDIFELWIALPRYEEEIHTRFSAWCRRQKRNRAIGFLEGNHEFFVAQERFEAFTWCTQNARRLADCAALFVHGDQINRKDKMYHMFKKLTKNKLSKFILGTLPCGPWLIKSLQLGLNRMHDKSRAGIPEQDIVKFAESRFAEGVDIIFMGHFHREYCYRRDESKQLRVLPDWLSTQKITIYQERSQRITTIAWQELPAAAG